MNFPQELGLKSLGNGFALRVKNGVDQARQVSYNSLDKLLVSVGAAGLGALLLAGCSPDTSAVALQPPTPVVTPQAEATPTLVAVALETRKAETQNQLNRFRSEFGIATGSTYDSTSNTFIPVNPEESRDYHPDSVIDNHFVPIRNANVSDVIRQLVQTPDERTNPDVVNSKLFIPIYLPETRAILVVQDVHGNEVIVDGSLEGLVALANSKGNTNIPIVQEIMNNPLANGSLFVVDEELAAFAPTNIDYQIHANQGYMHINCSTSPYTAESGAIDYPTKNWFDGYYRH